jgi:K+-sensing histidine kinase KdpD
MTIRQSEAGSGLSEVAREIAAPIAEIVDTLQRFALARSAANGSDAPAPDLLWRARHLAAELAAVAQAMAVTAPPPAETRAPHTTLVVRDAIARATEVCAPLLGTRRIVVRCGPRLAVTTQADRMHDLLVALIDEAARRDPDTNEIRASATRVANRLVIEIGGGVVAGRGLERLHHLARAVGGRIEVVAAPHACAALRVHIPQQRTDDVGDVPDDAA